MKVSSVDVVVTAKNTEGERATIPRENIEYDKIVHGNVHFIGIVLVQ